MPIEANDLVGGVGQPGRVGGLLEELVDREAVRGGLDHPELPGLLAGHPDAGDGHAGAGLDVRPHHLRGVHPVDVVGAEDDDVLGPRVVDEVHRLVDRVGAALVPPRPAPLLGRHRGDVAAEHRRQPPALRDVPVERVRLVLRQHRDLRVAGVHQVRQHEVDQPVGAAERHGGFRPVQRERHQPLPLATGQDDAQDARHALDPSRRTRVATMRAAILTREYPPDVYGGAGVHVDFLVRELRALLDVDVHCMGEPREGATAHSEHDPRLAGANPALSILSADLSITAATAEVDLVHSHTWYANFAGHLSKLLHGVPHVVTAHSLEPQRPWKAEQLGGGYRVSSWVGAHRLRERRRGRRGEPRHGRPTSWTAYPALDPARVHVIHNGIDADFYRPDPGTEVLERIGVDLSRPYVDVRRPDHPAEGRPAPAARRAAPRPRRSSSCCSPVRPTPLSSRPRPTPRSPSCGPRRDGVFVVSEMLPREEVRQVLTHAAVFCCPSVYEPLGIVNLEAMACETAVVASRVGGIPEVVVDGETGLLVDLDPGGPRGLRAPAGRGAQRGGRRPGPGRGHGARRARPRGRAVRVGGGRGAHRRALPRASLRVG